MTPDLVPYSSDTKGDFILATVTLEGGKKIPIMLIRKDEGVGGTIFRYNALRVFRGNSPENFESMSKEEYLDPTLRQTAPPKQSLADIINSQDQSAAGMFDQDDIDQAQKAKEDCINPAKQVKDQIKKKPNIDISDF